MHLAQRSKRGGGEKEGRVVKSSKRAVRIAKHNKCARLLSPEGAVILDSRPRPLPPLPDYVVVVVLVVAFVPFDRSIDR